MEYLLDTNACIALIDRTSELVRKRFSKAVESGEPVWVPSVSLYELWYGVAKSVQTEANTLRLKMFLAGPVQVLEFGEEDARCAGEIATKTAAINPAALPPVDSRRRGIRKANQIVAVGLITGTLAPAGGPVATLVYRHLVEIPVTLTQAVAGVAPWKRSRSAQSPPSGPTSEVSTGNGRINRAAVSGS